MTFTPEQSAALDEKLSAFQSSLLDQFKGTMHEAISGLGKRLTTETKKDIETRFAPIEERLSGFDPDLLKTITQNALNEVLESLAADESAANDSTGSPATSGDSVALAELRKQMEKQTSELQQRVQMAETTANEERTIRTQLADKQRVSDMEQGFIKSIQGKVRTNAERDFLDLLRSNGLLVEENDQLLVKGKDAYQMEANLSIDQALPGLLKDRFPYMSEARPGTGTGGSGSSSQPAPSGKYFQGGQGNPDTESLMAAMADPSKQNELFNELQGLMSAAQ